MDEGAVCIANIGLKERRKRQRFGVAMAVLGVVALVSLIGAGLPVLYRLGLFFPFWLAALGYFQAREKT